MWNSRFRNLLADLKKDKDLTEDQYADIIYDFMDILEKEISAFEFDYHESSFVEPISSKIKWIE